MTYSFDPMMAGVGVQTITYTFTDGNGCTASASDMIEVFALPVVAFTAPMDLCVDAGVQMSLGGGTPTGGIYSGPGVMDGGDGMTYSFDPATAGVGVQTITYTFTDGNGCTASASDMIEVFALPMVAFTAPADLCIDSGVQMSLGGGTPMGGTYSGPGVMDGGDGMTYSFDPMMAGIGVQTITYTFTDGNGCTASASDMIEVFALPMVAFTAPTDLCVDAGVQMSLGGGTPMGGTYSGPGVTDGGDGMTYSFDPMMAGVGVQTITYTFTDGNGCTSNASDMIEVFALPVVAFTAPADLCVDAGVQMNLGGGTPMGGTYSGPGVTDGGDGMTYSFDPMMAGVGVQTITYTFTDGNGCMASASDMIEVFALPVVAFTAPADLCVDAGVQMSLGGGTPMGGTYSGPGVTDGGDGMTYSFDPATAGVGVQTITYTFTDANGCTSSVSDMIEVFDLPNVNLTTTPYFCLDASISSITQTGGTPVGGIYSGPGVTDNGMGTGYIFNPMTAGTGIHVVTYTFTDANGCTNSATSTIEVFNCVFEATDPCSCLDNATVFDVDANTGGDDGQFSELISVADMAGGMLPAGQIWTVTAASGALDAYNIPAIGMQSAGVPVATDGSVSLMHNAVLGTYELPFVHVDTVGYSITVEGPFALNDPANVSISISNRCAYPMPVFDPLIADVYCPAEPAITLGGMDLFMNGADTVSFTINGMPATELDPSALAPGNYTVVMTFDGAADGNNGVSPDGGATAALPGCTQTVQKAVEILAGNPPIITCPADDFGLPVGCNPMVPAPATTFNIAGAPNPDPALPTVAEGCGTLTLSARDETTDDGCTRTVRRTYIISDQIMDMDSCVQTFTFTVDTDPPIFDQDLPSDTTVSCDAVPMADTLTASDNCPAATMVVFDEVNTPAGTCPEEFTLTRTWTATDGCGNTAVHTQMVMVIDTTAPVFDNPPADLTLECDEVVPAPVTVTATDNCATGPFTATLTGNVTTPGACPQEETITRTWEVTDSCGNTATTTQVITIQDTQAPLIACNNDLTITLDPGQCRTNAFRPVAFSPGDNCDPDPVVSQVSGPSVDDFLEKDSVYTFVFQAEDACGNIETCSFTLSVLENPTTISSLPGNDLVNVTLDTTCKATITADMVLEGGDFGCYEDYIVELYSDINLTNLLISSPCVTGDQIGQEVFYHVMDPVSGLSTWGRIQVEDKLAPVIDCPCEVGSNEDCTIACFEAQNFPEPIATDACGIVSLTSVEEVMDGGTCGLTSIRRTWTATDLGGNTATCVQEFFVEPGTVADVVAPMDFDGVNGNRPLNCENRCGGAVEEGDNNFCGRSDIFWNVLPDGHPFAGHPNPDDGKTWPCGDVKCFGTGRPGGAASCSNFNTTFEDTRINICTTGTSDGCYKIVRRWVAVDWCTGEVANFTQNIKIEDNEGPVLSDLTNVVISTDVWGCEADWDAIVPWIDDNCSSDPIAYTVSSSAGEVIFVNGNWRVKNLPLGLNTITYTATDCCGNETVENITVSVIDDVPPVPVCEGNTVVSISATQNPSTAGLGVVVVDAETFDDGSYDNCGSVRMFVRKLRSPCGSSSFGPTVSFCCRDIGFPAMVELLLIDEAGNRSTCVVEVTVQDKVPPFVVAPPDIVVTCDFWFEFDPDNAEEYTDILDDVFGAVSEDAVEPADRDSIFIIDRVCTAHPRFGEFATASPFDDPCYDDQYKIFWGIDGYVIDNCEVDLEQTIIPDLECGQGTITRRWRAADGQGNWSNIATQTITIINCREFYVPTVCWRFTPRDIGSCDFVGGGFAEKLIEWPCDIELNRCQGPSNEVFEPENLDVFFDEDRRPRFADDNCSLIASSFDDRTFTFVDSSCLKIFREWEVIDWCRFEQGLTPFLWEWTQVIKLQNEDGPEIEGCSQTVCGFGNPSSPNAPQCVGEVVIAPMITDDCTPLNQLRIDYKFDYFDDGSFDELGFSTTYGLIYPFPNPNNLAVRRFEPADYAIRGFYPVGTHRILWAAEDGCGNTNICEYILTIEDCKPPTAYCLPGVSSIPMPIEAGGFLDIWASDFNLDSYDNCTEQEDLVFSFSEDINDRSLRRTCNDVTGLVETLTIYVWDEAGNFSTCQVGLRLQDCGEQTTAVISGNIQNEEGEEVQDVMVQVENPGMNEEQMTGIDGFFSFIVPTTADYVVRPEKNINPLNGISTYDLVLISKHVLGIELLNSPYKRIAADVNKSGSISAFDLVDLRKLILYIDTEFQNNTSWRFVASDYVFASNDPFGEVFPEIFQIDDLNKDEQVNFVAVKIGDVNGSANANQAIGSETRNAVGDLTFKTRDIAMKAGNTYKLAIASENFTDVTGFQFSMNFDMELVEFVGIEAGGLKGLSDANFGTKLLHKGVLTSSWNDRVGVDHEGAVFQIHLRAKRDGRLSDVLRIGSDYTAAEAYKSSAELLNVDLVFVSDNRDAFTLLQNIPNPFKDETVIGFVLPKAGAASVTIYDASGKILRLIEGTYRKGYNELGINRSELNSAGVLYYTLKTAENSASKKMIILE
ncbi:MAG: T9SS type A sorting domain-containing protein [Bacteroidota bacterium]